MVSVGYNTSISNKSCGQGFLARIWPREKTMDDIVCKVGNLLTLGKSFALSTSALR